MKTAKEIAQTIDGIASASQQMHGGATPVEIYAKLLEHHAKQIRVYGADAGIHLLLGRLVCMMENAPAQAVDFAKLVASARTDACVDFLNEVSK